MAHGRPCAGMRRQDTLAGLLTRGEFPEWSPRRPVSLTTVPCRGDKFARDHVRTHDRSIGQKSIPPSGTVILRFGPLWREGPKHDRRSVARVRRTGMRAIACALQVFRIGVCHSLTLARFQTTAQTFWGNTGVSVFWQISCIGPTNFVGPTYESWPGACIGLTFSKLLKLLMYSYSGIVTLSEIYTTTPKNSVSGGVPSRTIGFLFVQ